MVDARLQGPAQLLHLIQRQVLALTLRAHARDHAAPALDHLAGEERPRQIAGAFEASQRQQEPLVLSKATKLFVCTLCGHRRVKELLQISGGELSVGLDGLTDLEELQMRLATR